MTTWNGFRGAAKRLEDIDLPRIGARIGVGADELHAFMEVEASGSGFDALGRPKMLFEPHVFYRHLPKALRQAAERAGLAYPKWRPGTYPKGSYPRLLKAMEIDESAALKACSWGLGQILGENHRQVGYDTVEEMVLAFMDDEEKHLEAMVQFLIANGLDDDLREHRWEALARGYNGPGYAKHGYDTRLAAAFAKWRGVEDTAWLPDAGAPGTEPPLPLKGKEPDDALAKFEVEAVQKRLRELGYFEVGKVDGIWGSRLTAALSAFQHDNGLVVDAHYGPQTKEALAAGRKRPVAPERLRTTVADLAAQGSRTVQAAWDMRWMGRAIGIASAVMTLISFLHENYGAGQQLVATYSWLMAFVPIPSWATPLLGLLATAYLAYKANLFEQIRLAAERSGLHNGEPDPAPSLPAAAAGSLRNASHTAEGRATPLGGFGLAWPLPETGR